MSANGLFGIRGLKANGIKFVFMKKEEQRLQLWRTLVSGTHAGAVESGEKDEGSAEFDGQTTLMWSETLKKWFLYCEQYVRANCSADGGYRQVQFCTAPNLHQDTAWTEFKMVKLDQVPENADVYYLHTYEVMGEIIGVATARWNDNEQAPGYLMCRLRNDIARKGASAIDTANQNQQKEPQNYQPRSCVASYSGNLNAQVELQHFRHYYATTTTTSTSRPFHPASYHTALVLPNQFLTVSFRVASLGLVLNLLW